MKKILVVEDSQSERDLITLYLEQNNYQVVSTNNAADGMELAAKEKPDLIITDITMEGVNGFEFCRLLKVYPDTENIPIHCLYGSRSRYGQVLGAEAGH